jgi:integrase
MSGWPYVVRSIGAEGLHFHDLRHTGNTFAAGGGAGVSQETIRADDGNRTRMTSLEGWSSTIELHPLDASADSRPQ